MSGGDRPSCSVKEMGEIPHTQKLFICKTCYSLGPCQPLCEGCARFCHAGHRVEDCGYRYGVCACGVGSRWCHCYLMHPLPGDTDFAPGEPRQCDFSIHKSTFHQLEIAACRGTCQMTGGQCICIPCAKICHHGHGEIADVHTSGSAYCDCGDPDSRFRCLLTHRENPEQRKYCSKCVKDEPCEQVQFYCGTCGVNICEACSINCHVAHGHGVQRISHWNTESVEQRWPRFLCECRSCVDSVEKREPAA